VTTETTGPAPLDPRAQQHMVPMRDGVRLATDVYLPAGAGPFPAVLVRLPYDKNGRYCWMPFIASHVIARGFAFVLQDVRGKFRSEGEPVAFVNEVPDGYDAIDWIARQPWSDGTVGIMGRQLLRFHAVAGRRRRASRAQGHRPARHDRRHRLLARGRDAALRHTLVTGGGSPSFLSLTVLPRER
jgi:hypothetical protein